jgi:hypothetical protein
VLNFFGKRLWYMQEVPRQERGFTLIELLVVVWPIGKMLPEGCSQFTATLLPSTASLAAGLM